MTPHPSAENFEFGVPWVKKGPGASFSIFLDKLLRDGQRIGQIARLECRIDVERFRVDAVTEHHLPLDP